MQLNLAQFLAELLDAECSMTVSGGVVTFEDGDTFDVAAHQSSDADAVTPLAAAGVLAAIHKDEPAIVEAFRAINQRERNRLAAALSAFYPVLVMENKYQPVLLDEPIKIPVTTFEEGLAVQRALFALGCGFHHGSYPLAKDISDECTLSGIFVSRKGVMTVMPRDENGSVEYVANHKDRAVSPATVLAATTLADLLAEKQVPEGYQVYETLVGTWRWSKGEFGTPSWTDGENLKSKDAAIDDAIRDAGLKA